MPTIRPFHTAEPTRLVELLNKPSFLRRSVTIPLRDSSVGPSGYWGNVAVDSIGGVTPEYVIGSRGAANHIAAVESVNILRAVPFVHKNGFRISQLSIACSAASANSVGRWGIYGCKDDRAGDFTPYRLIYGGASTATATAGTKQLTGLSIDLEPDRVYWGACVFGTAAPTIYTVPVANVDHLMGGSSGNPPTHTTMLQVAFTYAALPTSFPLGAVANTVAPPAIWVGYTRASATTTTNVYPGIAIDREGYLLQRARVIKGGSQPRTPVDRPYAVVKARVRTGDTTTVVATYDTRTTAVSGGIPLDISGASELGTRLSADTVLEAEITQSGWPRVSLNDAALEFDLTYAGA